MKQKLFDESVCKVMCKLFQSSVSQPAPWGPPGGPGFCSLPIIWESPRTALPMAVMDKGSTLKGQWLHSSLCCRGWPSLYLLYRFRG